MDCLEIVSVRLAGSASFEDAIKYCQEMLNFETPGRFEIYRCIGSGTDISVHLHRTYGPVLQEKSLLGLQLARGLGDYGLVSHSLWVDQQEIFMGQAPGNRKP